MESVINMDNIRLEAFYVAQKTCNVEVAGG
jgi:hypothetical protein